MENSSWTLISHLMLVCVPAVLVGGAFYLAMRTFVRRDQELRLLEIKAAAGKETRLLRLQAYERMVMFLERIAPGAIISRVLDPEMLSAEMQLAMIRNVRSEFEHNMSQQLYISSEAWQLIVSAKEEIIKTIGMIGARVPAEATAAQLSRIILEAVSNAGQQLPTETALEYLKAEAREMM